MKLSGGVHQNKQTRIKVTQWPNGCYIGYLLDISDRPNFG